MKLSLMTEAYSQPIEPRSEAAKINIRYWRDGDKTWQDEEFGVGNRGMAIRRIKTLIDQGYRVKPEIEYRDGKTQPIKM